VFREQNATSNWRSAKLWEMPSCMAIRQIRKQEYTSAAAADPARKYPSSWTHQGKGFDFGKAISSSLQSEPAGEHGRGIELMKVAIDRVSFERASTEVQKGNSVLSSASLKPT